MEFVKKLEVLNNKIDELVGKYHAVNDENIKLKRSLEEKDKEISQMKEEVEKFRLIKKEGVKILDNALDTLEKITKSSEEKSSEPLL